MCGAKMVHLFAVSNVVRGYGKYKDVRVFILMEQNFLVKENQEPGNPRDSYISCSFDWIKSKWWANPKALAMFPD